MDPYLDRKDVSFNCCFWVKQCMSKLTQGSQRSLTFEVEVSRTGLPGKIWRFFFNFENGHDIFVVIFLYSPIFTHPSHLESRVRIVFFNVAKHYHALLWIVSSKLF